MISQLTLTPLLERAGTLFPRTEIISRRPDDSPGDSSSDSSGDSSGDSTHRYTYREMYVRTRALAAALQRMGLRPGDRVATLMWNHYMHLEAYFGVPVVGGVLHTLNLRLHPDELAYIVNHAGDRFLIVDDVLLPVYEAFASKVKIERVIVTSFGGVGAVGGGVPAVRHGCDDYETLLRDSGGDPIYPRLDENDPAGLCYTSGTTGKPKGVVYSHRAIALHSFSISLPDNFAIGRGDTVLPLASMFHANAWGLAHASVMQGSALVFPGPNLRPERVLELLSTHRVTLTAGVPTIWLGVLDALERAPDRWPLSPGLRVIVAGSAAPEMLFRRFDRFGVRVIQAWGMTETTPIATVSTLKPEMERLPADAVYAIRAKQGLPSPFIEMRVMGPSGEAPWDGVAQGELQVRGPWVAASYYKQPDQHDRWSDDGWFHTGDIVCIDEDGCVKISDRAKDLIKSGGEWISSVDVENALVAHPAVAEAAVVAVPDPKWQERPLAVIVLKPQAAVTSGELRTFLAARFAKWQLPDDFVVVAELPHTSTGKLLKSALREQYKDWNTRTRSASGGQATSAE
jgi:fatty-acyl-CoA synthase